MEFYNIIGSLLSTIERKVCKLAKIHPITTTTFNNQYDIETGLYYGEYISDECRLIIHYNSDEECKWDY